MKYLVLIGNGLTDQPIAEKNNKTPLQLADTPNLDRLVGSGHAGTLETIPENLHAGNDISYLSLLGMDPVHYHAAPASFLARALGIQIQEGEVPLCCDFVILQSSHNDMIMKDFTADFLASEDSKTLLDALRDQIVDSEVRFHSGGGYNNLMVLKSPPYAKRLTPPNELVGEGIRRFMPADDEFKELIFIINQAQIILHNHPINQKRRMENLDPVNSVWLWGNGKPARLPQFAEIHGKKASVITPSLIFQGMAKDAGMNVVSGDKPSNNGANRFQELVETAFKELDQYDMAYLHFADPEVYSLKGQIDEKIFAIEDFDQEVVGPVMEIANSRGDIKILVLVNHVCSVNSMKYEKGRVPFLMYPAKRPSKRFERFDESIMEADVDHFKKGPDLIGAFLKDQW